MRNGNDLRAVLFDLDGTILIDRDPPAAQFIAFCARFGRTFDSEAPCRLERWQHEYWANQHKVDADLAEHGKDKFWLAYSTQQMIFLNIEGPLDEYAVQIDTWFRDEYAYQPCVPDDVRPTLTHLRDSGLSLGLVSNRSAPLGDIVTQYNLTDLFDFTLCAGEAASWKPAPGIFTRALQMANAAPETSVYVGDNYYADIVGARGVGLLPILIDPRGVFPDADCRVIREIGELRTIVG